MIAPDVLDLFVRNVDAPGDLRYRDVTVEESLGRDNYRQADNIDTSMATSNQASSTATKNSISSKEE